ncbi:MAG: hypothetical protein Q8R15_01345 [Candidatus Micrarchaeota archaeon]|nr:hypothetical protein [Candidatus Micrarchaeota archaeon]
MQEVITAARALHEFALHPDDKNLPNQVGKYKLGATVGRKIALRFENHPHVSSLELKQSKAGVPVVSAVMKQIILPRSSVGEEFTTIAKLFEGTKSDSDVDRVFKGEQREAIASQLEICLQHVEDGGVKIQHAEFSGNGFKITRKGPNVVISAVKPGEHIRITPENAEALNELLNLHARGVKLTRVSN